MCLNSNICWLFYSELDSALGHGNCLMWFDVPTPGQFYSKILMLRLNFLFLLHYPANLPHQWTFLRLKTNQCKNVYVKDLNYFYHKKLRNKEIYHKKLRNKEIFTSRRPETWNPFWCVVHTRARCLSGYVNNGKKVKRNSDRYKTWEKWQYLISNTCELSWKTVLNKK